MNSKRSYLDAVNAGRQRRSYASLEQLNRSLDTLEQRIERNREEVAGRDAQRRAAQPYGQAAESPRMPARPRPSDYRSAYEQPYQSIARDFERVRKEEDGVAAFGKIAGELKGLREELRHQMAASLRGEFDTLRKDFQQSYASGGKAASKLGMDVERLSSAIQSLGDRTDDRSVNMLRLEIEQMKSALDTLAREETVRSVDNRWDAFDQRFDDFEHRISAGAGQRANSAELAALTDRIEQIGQAVGSLPEVAVAALARGKGAHARRRARSFHRTAGRPHHADLRPHRGAPRRDFPRDRRRHRRRAAAAWTPSRSSGSRRASRRSPSRSRKSPRTAPATR